MSDLTDDIVHTPDALLSRTFATPQESTEGNHDFRVKIVHERQPRISTKLLPPLILVLMITSFVTGRATRVDEQALDARVRDKSMAHSASAATTVERSQDHRLPSSSATETVGATDRKAGETEGQPVRGMPDTRDHHDDRLLVADPVEPDGMRTPPVEQATGANATPEIRHAATTQRARIAEPEEIMERETGRLEAPADEQRELRSTVTVSGRANIYGAGLAVPPAPGGGGGGVLPVLINLSTLGNPAVLRFPRITGTVSAWAADGKYNGPDGGHAYGGITNVPAHGGISGIYDSNSMMFLLGVFLGPDGQPAEAPRTPNVSNADNISSFSPLIGQQFFIGDGRSSSHLLQKFAVPEGATRLYLGFAEKYGFWSQPKPPGFYDDNGGELAVDVEAASDIAMDSATLDDSVLHYRYHTISNKIPFTIGVYQCATSTWSDSATLITTEVVTPPANASGAGRLPLTFTPRPGHAYLFVVADPFHAISEADESNNSASVVRKLTPGATGVSTAQDENVQSPRANGGDRDEGSPAAKPREKTAPQFPLCDDQVDDRVSGPSVRAPDGEPARPALKPPVPNLLEEERHAAETEQARLAARNHLERQASELHKQGIQLRQQGELESAGERFRKALSLLEQIFPGQDHVGIIVNTSELGLVFQQLGQYEQAIDCYRKSHDMSHRIYKAPNEYKIEILNKLGECLAGQGRFVHAVHAYNQALNQNKLLYRNKDNVQYANILNNIGSSFIEQGDYARALLYCNQALQMSSRLSPDQDNQDIAADLNNVGKLLLIQGKHTEALAFQKRSLDMKKRLCRFQDNQAVADGLNNVGFILFDQGDNENALVYFNQSLDMRRRLNRNGDEAGIARGLENIAFALFRQGKSSDALMNSSLALQMRDRLYPPHLYRHGHIDLLDSLNNQGKVLHSQGKDAEALVVIRRAVALREAIFNNFISTASEAESLNFSTTLSSHSSDLILSVMRNTPGDARSLYSALWNCKATVSRKLQLRQRVLARTADPAARTMGQELLAIRHHLAGLLMIPADLSDNASRAVQRLTERKEELERLLEDRMPEYKQLLALSSQQMSANLSSILPRATVFIDFFQYLDVQQDPAIPGEPGSQYTPSLVAFIVRPGSDVIPVFLGASAPIEEAVLAWRGQIQDEKRSDSEATGFRTVLRSLIWNKLEPHFPPGTATILISPDSALASIPWAALPGRNPNGILLEDYSVAIIPSGVLLLEWLGSTRKGDPISGELLCVGDVAYSPDGQEGIWRELKATRDELTTITRLAEPRRAHFLTGEKASTTAVLDRLPRARWAHLATHGFFANASFRTHVQVDESRFESRLTGGNRERFTMGSRSPMVLSGLVLAGANLPRSQDEVGELQGDGGILTAEAIAGLSLPDLEMVVLSACETGLGEVDRGEGVFGLQRAFHTAGARNVVASLWNVKSKATTALMKIFYHKLWAESKMPIKALCEAQLELYRHPELIDPLDLAEQTPNPDPSRGLDLSKTLTIDETGVSRPTAHTPIRKWAGFVLSGSGD